MSNEKFSGKKPVGGIDISIDVVRSRSMQVSIQTQFEGIHCWPHAPEEVAFLRSPHRHMFEVYVNMSVTHDDREVEFIMLKHEVEKYVRESEAMNMQPNGVCQLYTMSCEQIANGIIDHLEMLYGSDRYINVGVFEDDENGCWVEATS